MSGLNPVDVVEEDAADLLFPKDSSQNVDPFNSNVCEKCRVILHEPFVSCAECSELFCLSCFAKGSETRDHKNCHSYKIVRDNFKLFSGCQWTAREEKVFLNAMLKCGVGNWDEISAALGNKAPSECRIHFYTFYFDGVFGKRLGMSNESAYARHNVPYLVKSVSLEPPRGDENSFVATSMSGYRFARSEFDVPYDNSAESILNNISLDDDEKDSQITSELNCALFRAYNHRLRERYRRYRILSSHGLILQRKTLAWLSKYTEMFHRHSDIGKFASFMQISDPMSFDFLMESMKYYFDTKRYLYRLFEFRKNGIKSLSGGKLYMKLKNKRTNNAVERKNQFLDWKKLVQSETGTAQVKNVFLPPTSMITRKKAIPLDVIGLPGFDRLTEDEKLICSDTRLTPLAFLEYKRILSNENTNAGYLRLSDARRLIKIDVNKTREIYNFLIKTGSVNAPLS